MKNVQLPVSKSLYIRKLIYDFLYNDGIGAIPSDSPEDVRVLHQCLTIISKAKFCSAESAMPQRIDVRDCGAAYRFLMAVLAVTPGQWLLTGTPRLMQRPIDELVQVLCEMGAEIQWRSCRDAINCVSNGGGVYPCIDIRPCVSSDNSEFSGRDAINRISTNENCGCWKIRGKNLHASELTIDCTRSGQIASALWLISEKIGLKKLHILPENPSSSAYIAMTKAIVEGKADMDAKCMGDWSAAVYWYARLLLEGQVCRSQRHSSSGTVSCDVPSSYKLLHLDLQSLQSDAIIAQWFAQWGVVSRQKEDGVVIEFKKIVDCQKNTLTSGDENASRNEEIKLDKSADIQYDVIKSDEGSVGLEDNDQEDTIELDMSQNLDLVPVLACMACLWPKKMVFNGVSNLQYKESNRLQIIQEQLSSFSKIEIKSYKGIADNQLVINPICRDGVFSFDAHNDHRFVMGFSLFALRGKVQIKDFDCVRKSYPDFKAEGVVTGTDIVG